MAHKFTGKRSSKDLKAPNHEVAEGSLFSNLVHVACQDAPRMRKAKANSSHLLAG